MAVDAVFADERSAEGEPPRTLASAEREASNRVVGWDVRGFFMSYSVVFVVALPLCKAAAKPAASRIPTIRALARSRVSPVTCHLAPVTVSRLRAMGRPRRGGVAHHRSLMPPNSPPLLTPPDHCSFAGLRGRLALTPGRYRYASRLPAASANAPPKITAPIHGGLL